MYTFILIVYVLVSISLILVVLLQSSKGGGLAGVLGGAGGAASALFGGRGAAGFLTKTTAVLAVLFVLGCLVLNALTPTASEDVRSATLKEMERQTQEKSPAAALPSSVPEPVIPGTSSPSDSAR